MSKETLAARLREALRALPDPPRRPERWKAGWLVRAFSTPADPTPDHFAVAARCLAWAASDRNPNGPDPAAARALEHGEHRARLAALLVEWSRRLAARLVATSDPADAPDTAPEPPGSSRPGRPEESARWDEALAATLARLGEAGESLALSVRERSLERHHQSAARELIQPTLWMLWLVDEDVPETPRWAHLLCRLLWTGLRQRVEDERRKPPAIVRPLLETLAEVQRPGNRLAQRGEEVVLADRQGRKLALLEQETPVASLDTIDALIHTGTRLLSTLNAHRTLRWMITTAHRRVLSGERDARLLKIEGGWSGLTELVGARSKKGEQDLKAIITALGRFRFALPDGTNGTLLAYLDMPATGRRPAVLEITLGSALLPNYVFQVPRGQRALVPIPELPPMVGRERDYGPQAALQLYLMVELRSHARDLAETGAVKITAARWLELAAMAGLSPPLLDEVIGRWTQDGGDGPAFLSRVETDRYTLAPAHSVMLDFIIEAGRLETGGAEAGRRGAQRKRGRLIRKRDPQLLSAAGSTADATEKAQRD